MIRLPLRRPTFFGTVAALAVSTLLVLPTGCNILGFAASALPPPIIEAAYKDLGGHSVAVVIWAEPEVDISHPSLTRQVGKLVEDRLVAARDKGNRTTKASLEEMTIPLPADSYIRAFKDDPTLIAMTGEEFSGLAGAERVIYVQITQFTTRGGAAAGLVRGAAELGIVVYEVEDPITTMEGASLAAAEGGADPGVEAYREQAIEFNFPKDGLEEGSQRLRPDTAYAGLVDALAQGIVDRFVERRGEEPF